MAWTESYDLTLLALGLMGLILFVQMLVVDIAGMKARHVPGYPIEPDHRSFLFRTARAHANSNESIAVFILLALFGMFSGASPGWLGNMAMLTVAGRLGHMLSYYAGLGVARSIAFGVVILGLAGMLVVGVAVSI